MNAGHSYAVLCRAEICWCLMIDHTRPHHYHPEALYLCAGDLQSSLSYQQLVDKTRWSYQDPYQESIADNELIVDKVDLMNKEPYRDVWEGEDPSQSL